MSRANTRQTHPLIPREQTYVLDRKIVSIHSLDRDIKKWPHANHFEINLPETLSNVQSMRLVQISLPCNPYIFSNENQNTKLSFRLEQPSPFPDAHDDHVGPCCFGEYTITLRDGSYTPEQLAVAIANLMNSAVFASPHCSHSKDKQCVIAHKPEPQSVGFVCAYDEVANTFWFGNHRYPFTLLFGKREVYTDLCQGQVRVFDHYTRWGLPAYLGYKKQNYKSTKLDDSELNHTNTQYKMYVKRIIQFDYMPDCVEVNACGGPQHSGPGPWIWPEDTSKNVYVVNLYDPSFDICNLDIHGEDAIYMEIDRYNTMDEIKPYSCNTSGWFNNDYNGKVNSAFAKIPVTCAPYSQIFDSRQGFLTNISHYQPPIQKISRLRFKFRYHDGRLVDFKCLPLNFSLEFNMLKDEQLRAAIIRIPPLYQL